MIGFDVLTLIGREYDADELGQRIPRDTQREVFANVVSVSQSEFFSAAASGLRPEYKAILTTSWDYGGEEIAEYQGRRYAIYRTYRTESDQMELYLRREAGERHE